MTSLHLFLMISPSYKYAIKANFVGVDRFIRNLDALLKPFLSQILNQDTIQDQLEAISLILFETLSNTLEHDIWHYNKEQIFLYTPPSYSFLQNHLVDNFNIKKINICVFLQHLALKFIFRYPYIYIPSKIRSNQIYGGNGKKIIEYFCTIYSYQFSQKISQPGRRQTQNTNKQIILESIKFIFKEKIR